MADDSQTLYERAHSALSSFFGLAPDVKDDYVKTDPAIYKEFPSDKDVVSAQTNRAFYNKPYDSFTRPGDANIAKPPGRTLPDTNKELTQNFDAIKQKAYAPVGTEDANRIAKEGLLANRSSVATLGFDPAYPIHTGDYAYGNSAGAFTTNAYDGKEKGMWVSDRPGVLTHESIHRGINKLRLDNENPNSAKNGDGPLDEEHIVRRMMQRMMGDPEKERRPEEFTKMLNDPKYVQRLDDYITKLEKIAADKHAKNNPRGPR